MNKLGLRSDQKEVLALLRQVRTEAGLTREQVAQRLDRPQSFVSKYETGERRLDILELREVCAALQLHLSGFVSRLEDMLA